jgi:hypothetical protein
MGLPIPIVGVDTGPNWANGINNCLNVIAEHTHAAGSGVQITPSGLNINAPLLFNGNPIQTAAYINMLPQGPGVLTPINDSIYISGVDLFFRDGAGNTIRITQGGNVLASSSGISLGTASAAFVGNTLTVIQAPGVPAPIDAATYILRYNGSYPTIVGSGIALQAPVSIISSYALTFPNQLPSVNGSALTSNLGGNLSFSSPDQIGSNMTAVGADAIGQSMTSLGANNVANVRTRTVASTVPAGGVAISASSGVFVVNGNVSQLVPGLSVTITTRGRPVYLSLTADGTTNGAFIGGNNTSQSVTTAFYAFLRNGSTIGAQETFLSAPGSGSCRNWIPPGSLSMIDFPAAGTYTYTLSMSASNALGDQAFIEYSKLVAFEL